MPTMNTHIGIVDYAPEIGFSVLGTQEDLSLWANRPGKRWPCSALAAISPDARVIAAFDVHGDLVDLEGDPEDLLSDELTAWVADALRAAGLGRLADEQDARATWMPAYRTVR